MVERTPALRPTSALSSGRPATAKAAGSPTEGMGKLWRQAIRQRRLSAGPAERLLAESRARLPDLAQR